MELTQDVSKVEVKGLEARYYDRLMDIITLGYYPKFIKKAIDDLGLKEGQKVLDFGAGTGRNALLMRKYIKESGKIVALEIGKEMKEQFLQKTKGYENILLKEQRIDEPFELGEKFDLVFISFVLHGFIQQKRDVIIENAKKHLKPGGVFAILDYANFDVESANPIVKFAIRKIECPLAEDFIKRDTKQMLEKHGFGDFEKSLYFKKYVRLLKGKKEK